METVGESQVGNSLAECALVLWLIGAAGKGDVDCEAPSVKDVNYCDKVIVSFVWDNARRENEHGMLEGPRLNRRMISAEKSCIYSCEQVAEAAN